VFFHIMPSCATFHDAADSRFGQSSTVAVGVTTNNASAIAGRA
jgi:hypothetical protein